ncbi:hypothetical protein [Nocardia nepalensis]|uniref:hypothetical protein n=1 Tax=Nocardia nepalensis TaxID=3375448 RepID=UPI003B6785C7
MPQFQSGTGITLEPSCGIDTSYYAQDWHHPPIATEVVTTDFADTAIARRRRSPASVTQIGQPFTHPVRAAS